MIGFVLTVHSDSLDALLYHVEFSASFCSTTDTESPSVSRISFEVMLLHVLFSEYSRTCLECGLVTCSFAQRAKTYR